MEDRKIEQNFEDSLRVIQCADEQIWYDVSFGLDRFYTEKIIRIIKKLNPRGWLKIDTAYDPDGKEVYIATHDDFEGTGYSIPEALNRLLVDVIRRGK